MSPRAPIARPSCWTPTTAAIATPSPTAPTAARGSASSRHCPTTGANTPCAGSPCAPRARTEYDSPWDRRFHAQPNACPVCGPRWTLWDEGVAALVKTREESAPSRARLYGGFAGHGQGCSGREDRRGQRAGRISSDGGRAQRPRRFNFCASANIARKNPSHFMFPDRWAEHKG